MKLHYLVATATLLLGATAGHPLRADNSPESGETRSAAEELVPAENYLHRADVREFLDQLSRDSDLDRNRLAGIMARAKRQQSVLDAISKPAERTLNWARYRPIFLTQKRIDQGREFMREHAELLERATETYGVPADIITAIIGVETFYGRITGSHDVLDSLATLAFDYPPRATFFRSELAEFLSLSAAEGWDPHQRQGSYAGAMGVPQFISSSYRQYAVDFDGDGKRDLFDSMADVIGSVANYFAVHGWEKDAPVAERWSFPDDDIPAQVRSLVRSSLTPTVAGDTVAALGFTGSGLGTGTRDNEHLSVMVLEGGDGDEAWVAYRNFYVITRYNHSRLYAMAVLQLAQGFHSNPE
ncbi:lytic murein transglycosylase B [Granulosicoccus sp. 3-233]